VIAREVIAIACLALAAAIVVASSIGILVMPDAYDKLHYITPAAIVAPVLVTIAIFVWMGLSENTGQTIIALAFMVLAGPFLSHATLRAIRVRDEAAREEEES
jgi:monovalent cation/proton antiporter MnhG/PhaG subunit